MQDDEITLDTQEEQQESEAVEIEETPTEEPAIEAEPKDEGVKLSPAEYRHFKKWEQAQKPPVQKVTAQPQPASHVNVEETVLRANGMPDELIEELKLRAPKYGGSLIKAQTDSNYVAVKEKFEREKKSNDASLGASRGSGSVKPKKTASTPGLSREEHMAFVKGQ
jgi:hypothetical protein